MASVDAERQAALTLSPVLVLEIQDAFFKPGVPHRLQCGLSDFPLDILIATTDDDKTKLRSSNRTTDAHLIRSIFQEKKLLVLGADMGGSAVRVPEWVLATHIVLILRTNGHYGCRAARCVPKDATTWEGPTDPRPCDTFWTICNTLALMGIRLRVRFLGISAGVDSILSMVVAQTLPLRQQFIIEHFVAIVGAFRPTLYYGASALFR